MINRFFYLIMKIYKWQGNGHYLGAVMIFLCDNLESAKEMIKTKLIDSGLSKSWEEYQEIEVIELDDCKMIWGDNGDY